MSYLFLLAFLACICSTCNTIRVAAKSEKEKKTTNKSKTHVFMKSTKSCVSSKSDKRSKDPWLCPTGPFTFTTGVDISLITPGTDGADGNVGADSPSFGVLRALGTTVDQDGFSLSLIKFDLPPAIPTETVVNLATLRFVALSGTSGDPVTLKRVLSPWDETTTGAQIPQLQVSGTITLPGHTEPGPVPIELDVTVDVVNFIMNPESNHGWALVNPKSRIEDTFVMASFDSNIFQTPTLEIIFE